MDVYLSTFQLQLIEQLPVCLFEGRGLGTPPQGVGKPQPTSNPLIPIPLFLSTEQAKQGAILHLND